MSSASSLSDAEVSLILGMLDPWAPPTNQAILSYFTRPGRDINHRVIAEIENGRTRPGVLPATTAEVTNFMAAVSRVPRPNPDDFVSRTLSAGARHPLLLLNWWPVGQGLFASGAIVSEADHPLNWVYDCGTASSDSLMDGALQTFSGQQIEIGASRIRLCILSHFDRDHVSGVIRLIDRFPVTTLLLPYIPLWQRLVIALEQGVGPDDPLLGFFLDPVVYLTGGRAGRVREIVFVPPAGPDRPTPIAPEDIDGDPGGGALDLELDYGQPPEEAANDPATTAHSGVSVRFLRPAGRLVVPLLWEFVPYNDAGLAPKSTSAFLDAAGPLIAILQSSATGRATALKDLRQLYDDQFGATSKLRNLISLFLYSGPLGGLGLQADLSWTYGLSFTFFMQRVSQIHTGDGTLDEGTRYEEFARFFGVGGRLSRTALFQVMHHGSRHNWHEGIAAKLAPDVSIFSSDPAHRRFRHPHAKVLRDFWRYGATQVDRRRGYWLKGRLAS
jgi:hypothetical protein